MSVKPVLTYPDSRLRRISTPIGVSLSLSGNKSEITELVIDLADTMLEHNGLGISAPQIGVFKRVIVIHKDVAKAPEHIAFVNPQIEAKSVTTKVVDEGCLSFPGLYLPVRRHEWIKVKVQDPTHNVYSLDLDGLFAQAVEHEIEHLDGKLLIDYASRQVRRQWDRRLDP